ncbi:hypothetical protein [Desulfuromonas acetoxidans]|uniref:hypothetical protein n=1 Tax=Desulfuromonas acetoxidans TaxID=891 RepID=UPI0029310A35|nr:hypothetical protein [Desulfuromonas acetoxidans]
MLMNTTIATHAPVTLTALSWLCETLLAQVVAFFDALEAWLPRYLALMIVAGTVWCGYTSGIYGALLLGLPLGGVMALSYGLVVVLAMFLLGLGLWLMLIPVYWLADSQGWQLPTVLENHTTVSRWLRRWPHWYQRTDNKTAVQLLTWLVIGALLGCWLRE